MTNQQTEDFLTMFAELVDHTRQIRVDLGKLYSLLDDCSCTPYVGAEKALAVASTTREA